MNIEKTLVTCRACGFSQPGEGTQSPDIACSYGQGRIYGHYPSDFDCTLIALSERARLTLPHGGEKPLDPICDHCIRRWLASDDAVEIGEYVDIDNNRITLHPTAKA